MADERRMIRRTLGFLGVFTLVEIYLSFMWLPAAIGFPVAMVGFWAVDHFFIGWMDLAFRREQDAVRGAEAEEKIGAILDRLPNCVVLHGVRTKYNGQEYGDIDHVVFRKDGAVLLIETKSHPGTITEERVDHFLKQTHRNVFWLREFLARQLSFEPWIHAAIVFPNGDVRVRRALRGVDVVGAPYLDRWLSKARGKPHVAKKLWPEMERIKKELTGQGETELT